MEKSRKKNWIFLFFFLLGGLTGARWRTISSVLKLCVLQPLHHIQKKKRTGEATITSQNSARLESTHTHIHVRISHHQRSAKVRFLRRRTSCLRTPSSVDRQPPRFFSPLTSCGQLFQRSGAPDIDYCVSAAFLSRFISYPERRGGVDDGVT